MTKVYIRYPEYVLSLNMNAVITGATKGIGKAIAKLLATKGYNLAVCARNKHELDDVVAEMSTYGVQVIALVADCRQKSEVKSFLKHIQLNMATIDVLVNNVGVFLPGNLLDETDDDFEIQQQVNLNAAYYLSKELGNRMRQQGFGHIFDICSIAAIDRTQSAASYTVTKAAMHSLNHVLRKELAPHGVKVTAILPGATLTHSWSGTTIPPDVFIQPEDVADMVYAIMKLSAGANVDEVILTPLHFNH